MTVSRTGRCYCGSVRYESVGEPVMQMQCHCRECQYITGGSPNVFMGVPAASFKYTQGEPTGFTRSDWENPVTREFCPTCGTHLLTRSPNVPDAVFLKVGTLDDPSEYTPQVAIFACDMQSFHRVPEGVATFDRLPG